MFVKKYYDRFVSDIRKSVRDEDLRYQIQFRYMLKILFAVVVISGVINLYTGQTIMGELMLLQGVVYFFFYMIVYKLKTAGAAIVTWLMILSTMTICVGVLVHGNTEGLASIWILLFPIVAVLLIGKRKGIICSLVMLGIIIFLFHTPWGRGLLQYRYTCLYMQRYPMIYVVSLIIAIFYETLRSTMVEELQNQKQQMEYVYQNQYHSLETRIAEARKIRHDLRHHFLMITQFLKDGQIEDAQSYIDQYYKALPFEESLTYCEHYATNALLTYYCQLAKDYHIKVDVHLHMPSEISISTEDLTVVLGNLLENAVHANVEGQMEEPQFDQWIRIAGHYEDSTLTLTIKNPSLHLAELDSTGQYLSTKHEGAGIGVRSVRDVVEKYHGSIKIEQLNHTFSVSLIMYGTRY